MAKLDVRVPCHHCGIPILAVVSYGELELGEIDEWFADCLCGQDDAAVSSAILDEAWGLIGHRILRNRRNADRDGGEWPDF